MAPLLGSMLRMAHRGSKLSDDFNRTISGGLGSTSVGGYPWEILSGSWSDDGSRPTTSTSQSSNPLAVVNTGEFDVTASLTLGAGDALYFRVQDASNWWRLAWEGWQSSSCQTCCSTCCSTCCQSCFGHGWDCVLGGCSSSCPSNCNCPCTRGTGNACTTTSSCSWNCNCSSCNCTSCNCSSCNCTYYNNYRLRIERMVSGSLSAVRYDSTLSQSTVTAKVVLSGSSIQAYRDSYNFYSGTDSTLSTATRHGIGRANSSYNTSAIDNFAANWN